MRTLLIDGDILIYKIATQNEEPTHWGEGLWTLHCDENICKAEVDRQIQEPVSYTHLRAHETS